MDGRYKGSCRFRPFYFYSKLKIEIQKFTIVSYNVWFLKNWKSQIYNLNFQSSKKSKIENWKWSVGGFYFLFLGKRKTNSLRADEIKLWLTPNNTNNTSTNRSLVIVCTQARKLNDNLQFWDFCLVPKLKLYFQFPIP